MDNWLMTDLSWQMRHPMAQTSANASNCYDRIHHIILSFLLHAVTGCIGWVVAILYPMQIMQFFQRTAWGDSETFFCGKEQTRLLQGMCQRNKAGPGCWTMMEAAIMQCYQHQGFSALIILPIYGYIIDCVSLALWMVRICTSSYQPSRPRLRSGR